ncbi:MAG: SDR family oxidoreductase [Patescibacteria group bacterium]|nr:SDR family oxidoreductase [Patescibacteria group bacterium]
MAGIKIIGTGLSGLIGSRIVELLGENYSFENLSLDTGTDITIKESVFNKFKNSDAEFVIHLAAKTDVDGCEKDKQKDLNILKYKDIKNQEETWIKEKTAWAVNVLGTKNIVEACKSYKKKLIYVSTDFVFDGVKGDYSEEDKPNPINWYGKTKYEGEKIVESLSGQWMILRTTYPYRAKFTRKDFVRGILSRLQMSEKIAMVEDHIMAPTFIDDFVFALDYLIKNKIFGILHLVGSQFISPYESALLITQTFGLDRSLITKTTREEFFKNRAMRPFRLTTKNDKIQGLGLRMRTFEEGLKEIKRQGVL